MLNGLETVTGGPHYDETPANQSRAILEAEVQEYNVYYTGSEYFRIRSGAVEWHIVNIGNHVRGWLRKKYGTITSYSIITAFIFEARAAIVVLVVT